MLTGKLPVAESEAVMFMMIRAMFLAAFKQPTPKYKYELWQREQARWYKRHAGIGNGPSDLDGKQTYFGNSRDETLF